jgi:peptide/nickel transport system permease protein
MSREIENNIAEQGKRNKGESLTAVYVRRFRKHTLGNVGAVMLLILYFLAIFAGVLSPVTMTWTDKRKSFHPPTRIKLYYREEGRLIFRPYVDEMIIRNVAFKRYSVVPEYTVRAQSVETAAGFDEFRAVAEEETAQARKRTLMRELSRKYRFSLDSVVAERLSADIDRLEASEEKNVTITTTIDIDSPSGDKTAKEIMLIKGNKNFLRFFFKGAPYRFWNMFTTKVHFFGSPTGGYFLIGADQLGRDVLSRLLYGSRISLSVGLIGIIISFFIGVILGGIAGYFGGIVDTLLMRLCEIILSFPSLILLFALRATFPPNLNSIQVYLLIVLILSLIGWAGLARIIRGMVLSLKNEEFVLSARAMGLSHLKIISRHVLRNTVSFLIIQATITIPNYILGESALSLLGLGITDPQSSWGLMLSAARKIRFVEDFPWLLIPGFFIFIAIMAWNFFGDGIRDAVDPHSRQ